MDKKLKTPKGLLNCFFELLNADLGQLSNPRLHELWDQLRGISYGNLGFFVVTDEDIIRWNESTRKLKDIQENLRALLEKILEINQKKPRGTLKPIKDFERREQAMAEYGEGMVRLLEAVTEDKVPKWAQEHIALDYAPRTLVMVRDRVFPYVPKLEDRVLDKFLNALGEFPLSSIKRCEREDCLNYFLEATKREKRYCSDKCAWVIASRERRAKER